MSKIRTDKLENRWHVSGVILCFVLDIPYKSHSSTVIFILRKCATGFPSISVSNYFGGRLGIKMGLRERSVTMRPGLLSKVKSAVDVTKKSSKLTAVYRLVMDI